MTEREADAPSPTEGTKREAPPAPPSDERAREGPAAPPAQPPAEPPASEPAAVPEAWETRFKYLLADFENFRKRAERDREASRLRAEADLLKGLLPIHDAFERAREFIRNAPRSDPIRTGMELLAREWDEFLKREGIVPVATVGGRFDPSEQEVVGESAPGPGHPPETVLEVVQQGYRFRGGLLRAAKVLLARLPPAPVSRTPSAAPTAGSAADPVDRE